MTSISWVADDRPVADAVVLRAVEAALDHGGRPGLELSVVFASDELVADLHAQHLGDPTRTDVITFDLGTEGRGPAGELYVSVARARDVAARRGQPVERELLLYVVHGVLHLCGFDDGDEPARRRMRAAEEAVLRRLGHGADPLPHDLD